VEDQPLAALLEAIRRARDTSEHLRLLVLDDSEDAEGNPVAPSSPPLIVLSDTSSAGSSFRNEVYDALLFVSESLARGYAQVKIDLASSDRLSWTGDAHEVREIIATLLRTLAPDEVVKSQSWFKPESNDGRPTQKQRARFVMQQRKADSTEREVAEQVDLLEDAIGNLIRSTYSRASNAAHTFKGRSEVAKLVRYFEAFAHDLLDVS
jgi:hypothetical protein